jgi:murein DD-endopeptidase MepM/ murein hydrolase activator NlpD
MESDAAMGPAPMTVDAYGFPARQFERRDFRVKRNQTFSDLLVPFNVDYERIVELARSSRSVFDVRRMRAGNAYRVYLDDTAGEPKYLVYEQDRLHYVVFSLGDSLHARVAERPLTVRQRTVSGVINSSLYETLVDADVNPMLANEMADVFAWQIDFYRIQQGDSFKVIYDELRVDGEAYDIGTIRAARFNHMGEDYYAFHYASGTIDEHYDENGASLRKAFLIAPVKYSRISSGYSSRRFHPVQKIYKAHLGTDYVAPYGTPIVATGDGVVQVAGFKAANGNWVKIRHNGTYQTGYLHMSRIAKGIRPGVHVKQDQVIGYVGHTGLATGDHVCYRFWKNGSQVDHRREKIPSVGPIPDEHRAAFEQIRDTYMAALQPEPAASLSPAYAMLLRQPLAGDSSAP